jgi:hypothetical protein
MSVATLDTLEKRLGRLEREIRWWRVGALGAVVLLVALGAAPRGTTLEAERLVIRDAKGTVRAVLGSETGERGWSRLPYLLWLPKPAPEAKFGLYLYTEQGVEVSHLNLSPDGNPQLLLIDPQQRAVAAISTHLGAALVGIAAGVKTREEFVAAPGAGYRLEGSSEFGSFNLLPAGLTLFDKDGQSRAVLGRTELETIKTGTVEQRAESSLVLFDRDGKVLWQAP